MLVSFDARTVDGFCKTGGLPSDAKTTVMSFPDLDCSECGETDGTLVGYSPRAGGAVCRACADGAIPLSAAGIAGIEGLLARPLADAAAVALGDRSARDALVVITAAYEYYGNFRLRTLRSA